MLRGDFRLYVWVSEHLLVVVYNFLHLNRDGVYLGPTTQLLLPKLLDFLIDAWIGSYVERDQAFSSAQGGYHAKKELFA